MTDRPSISVSDAFGALDVSVDVLRRACLSLGGYWTRHDVTSALLDDHELGVNRSVVLVQALNELLIDSEIRERVRVRPLG